MARKTGDTPVSVIKKGVALYEKLVHALPPTLSETSKLQEIVKDPAERSAFQRVMSAMATRMNNSMTTEEKKERGRKGAQARHDSLTADQRREIARAAGKKGLEKRWGKKNEE